MKTLLSYHNSIHDYVLIINKMNKTNMKNKTLREFIEIIKEKDNIPDDEINLINTLDINEQNKEKIKKILNSKEKINKELIAL